MLFEVQQSIQKLRSDQIPLNFVLVLLPQCGSHPAAPDLQRVRQPGRQISQEHSAALGRAGRQHHCHQPPAGRQRQRRCAEHQGRTLNPSDVQGLISAGSVTNIGRLLQGETPLDLAKQRKNVWMINHLQEARQAKGYDSPSYLKRLKMDKVNKQTHTNMLRYVLVYIRPIHAADLSHDAPAPHCTFVLNPINLLCVGFSPLRWDVISALR